MKITAIILAGGKSSRMGEDKGLMLLNEKPMVQYALDVVKNIVDDVMIIANQKGYEKFGYPVYKDLIKDSGPLAGIYTGLTYSKTQKNVVLSCDSPFITKEILLTLIDNSKEFDCIVAENNQITHQLIGVYDKNCLPIFKNELDNDQRKIKLAIQKVKHNVVNFNHLDNNWFNNINSKDDIKS